MITLQNYIVLSCLIFLIGAYGMLRRKNILLLLFSTEIMLCAVNILVVAVGHFTNSIDGQILALFIIAIAAAEVAIGLGLIIAFYKRYKTLDLDSLNNYKG